MKKLIVCCDGTWNTPEQEDNFQPAPTNVVRLFNSLAATAADGSVQLKYYHPGVGTEGTFFQRVTGGAMGAGLGKNIMSAYAWLAANYTPGDTISLFGFSRGAYTVRSLSGMLKKCGLLNLAGISQDEVWIRVTAAFEKGYRLSDAGWRDASWTMIEQGVVPIQLIGVWDTVGALGIPDDLHWLNILDNPKNWMFHDTSLGDHVRFARHAVAIDEFRSSFTATLWTAADNETVLNDDDDAGRVRQLWFPGAHSDVGGGYSACGLSNGGLLWMIEQAQNCAQLAFSPLALAQIKPDFHGQLHNSVTGVFAALRTRPRNRPAFSATKHFHVSALQRHENPPITQAPYHPATVQLAVGQSSPPLPIYARERWNNTGLFLEEGASYTFAATGQWVDNAVVCGPSGSSDGSFQIGKLAHLVGTVSGKIESLFQKASSGSQVDYPLSRRVEAAAWLSLVAVIANDGPEPKSVAAAKTNPNPDGSPYAHQLLLIGAGQPVPHTVRPTEAGYLYAFANDAWGGYDNNRGSVSLIVTRVS